MKLAMAALLTVIVLADDAKYSVRTTSAAHVQLMNGSNEPWSPAERVEWGPSKYATTFRALWNPRGLYLRFDAKDDKPWNTMTRRDDHLWEEEVVEIFLDVNRSGKNYAEIEISPANVICDVLMISPSPNKKNDLTWNFPGLESHVEKHESFWTALVFLPWNGFLTLPGVRATALPMKGGGDWRFNLFRIKRPGGPSNPEKNAVLAAWSPTGQPSFHVPAAFRELIFQP